MGGHEVGEAAGDVGAHADVDPGGEGSQPERVALAEVAGDARGTEGLDAARAAGEPWVQRDAVTDAEPGRLRSDLDDLGDDLVAHDVRERVEVLHRVVAEAGAGTVGRGEAGVVGEDHLRLRPADPGEQRSGDHPIGAEDPDVVDVEQCQRCPSQDLQVAVLGVWVRLGFRRDAEGEGSHGASVGGGPRRRRGTSHCRPGPSRRSPSTSASSSQPSGVVGDAVRADDLVAMSTTSDRSRKNRMSSERLSRPRGATLPGPDPWSRAS